MCFKPLFMTPINGTGSFARGGQFVERDLLGFL